MGESSLAKTLAGHEKRLKLIKTIASLESLNGLPVQISQINSVNDYKDKIRYHLNGLVANGFLVRCEHPASGGYAYSLTDAGWAMSGRTKEMNTPDVDADFARRIAEAIQAQTFPCAIPSKQGHKVVQSMIYFGGQFCPLDSVTVLKEIKRMAPDLEEEYIDKVS